MADGGHVRRPRERRRQSSRNPSRRHRSTRVGFDEQKSVAPGSGARAVQSTCHAPPRHDFPEDALASFCEKHGVRRFALFGSILRDDFGPDSDIDILVESDPRERVGLKFFAMQHELSELLGRPVDLHTPAFLGKHFRQDVVSSAHTLYDAA